MIVGVNCPMHRLQRKHSLQDDVAGAVTEAVSTSSTVAYGLSLANYVTNIAPSVAHGLTTIVTKDAARIRRRSLQDTEDMTPAERDAYMVRSKISLSPQTTSKIVRLASSCFFKPRA